MCSVMSTMSIFSFLFSLFFFFFSSRRRHTRSLRDWSSDVCSSDLPPDLRRVRDASCPHECVEQLVELGDRKSTRLNSSHVEISYAVFCLKKKTVNTSSYIDHVSFSGTIKPDTNKFRRPLFKGYLNI